jgi:RNA polymerase sigma-70 factor, ECF subfamily
MREAEGNSAMKINDEKSIEELCGTTWEQLYRFVYYKVQNREEAEDITQETYIKVISYMQKNEVKIDKFVSFLKTVSLNVLRDKWRKGKRQGIAVNLDDINPEAASIDDHTDELAQREAIENALIQLNEEQRTVIELRILKGYPVADTAKQMDKKENNIRVLQYRALQNLNKILKDEF